MKTIEEALEMLEWQIDRPTLENYISREWLRPIYQPTGWYFEDIDIARAELICHLIQDININEESIDIVLLLIDQLYTARNHIKNLTRSISGQPQEVQNQIMMVIKQFINTDKTP